jgi:hypothetical protein
MIVVRGDNIVSLSAEAPPHQPVTFLFLIHFILFNLYYYILNLV